jgi:hypothetical protein
VWLELRGIVVWFGVRQKLEMLRFVKHPYWSFSAPIVLGVFWYWFFFGTGGSLVVEFFGIEGSLLLGVLWY